MGNLVVSSIVEKLKDKYMKLWWDTDNCFPSFCEEITVKDKILKEKLDLSYFRSNFTKL